VKAKSLFDHFNAVCLDQSVDYFDNLSEPDQKSFNAFMMNRLVSMNMDLLPLAAEFSQYYGVYGSRESYLFYSQILPKGRQYNKYIKPTKETKYEEWLVELVTTYFNVSIREAIDYLDIFYSSDEGKADLRSICEKFGTDPKKFKKVKL
jgi:hypothetical protein